MDVKELRQITRCMLDICRCLDTIREGQFLKYGLTRGQHSFLTRIHENPGINQESLSSLLKVDRSTTAKALKKLTEKGYIKKVHPPNNKKDWILFVTEDKAKQTVLVLAVRMKILLSMQLSIHKYLTFIIGNKTTCCNL